MLATITTLSEADLERLRMAKEWLERPSIASRISSALGTPIESAIALLPENWSQAVSEATRAALLAALKAAVATVDEQSNAPPSLLAHKLLVTATGAGGGALGLVGLPVELPLSTVVMLRSIADIARSQGESLSTPEARLSCLEVFALGGASTRDDAAESGYFAIRSTLAKAVADAAQYVAVRGVADDAAPALIRLISRVAMRFGVPVSQKIAAQMVPAIGAAAGATINLMFMDHYQSMARGHFSVRRLERIYGALAVRAAYDQL
jgi:hypothetical protein